MLTLVLRAAVVLFIALIAASVTARALGAEWRGRVIAYVEIYGENTQARMIDTTHRRDRRLYSSVECGVSWLDDSALLLTGGVNTGSRYLVSVEIARGARLLIPAESGSAPAVSPDGRRIAFADNRAQVNSVKVLDRASGRVQTIGALPVWINRLRWSPDGLSLIAAGTQDNRLRRYYTLTLDGAAVPLDYDTAWSPDGSTRYTRDTRRELPVIYAQDAAMTDAFSLPVWTRAGDYAAFITRVDDQFGIMIFSAAQDDYAALIAPSFVDIATLAWSPAGDALVFAGRPLAADVRRRTLEPYNLYIVERESGAVRLLRRGGGVYINNFSRFCALAWGG